MQEALGICRRADKLQYCFIVPFAFAHFKQHIAAARQASTVGKQQIVQVQSSEALATYLG